METLRRTCATVPQPSELPFGVVRAVGRGIAVLHGGPRSPTEGKVLGVLFGKHIVGKLDSWAFRAYIQFQDQTWGL